MDVRFNFSNLAVEALFTLSQTQALAQGIVLTRERFWMTPGLVMLTPNGLEQLFRAGVVDTMYSQQFGPPKIVRPTAPPSFDIRPKVMKLTDS
jgi:hypothetical protein